MNKAGGYISIYRQITDWEWYKDTATKDLFIHLLLTANFIDTRFMGKTIKRGQVVTSLPSLSEETGLSVRQIRTAINHLISTGEVTNKSYTKYRVISIVNYDKYQDNRQTDRQSSDSQTTDKRQSNDRQTTDNRQHHNNDNKGNKANKGINTVMATARSSSGSFEQFWKEYPKKMAKQNALKAWQKINPDIELVGKIMDGLKRWKDSGEWDRDGGQYIPYPATWLNGRRWEDDVERREQNGTNKPKRVDYSWLPD